MLKKKKAIEAIYRFPFSIVHILTLFCVTVVSKYHFLGETQYLRSENTSVNKPKQVVYSSSLALHFLVSFRSIQGHS